MNWEELKKKVIDGFMLGLAWCRENPKKAFVISVVIIAFLMGAWLF